MAATNTKEVDVFRDTRLRYLGYANEVGESFRNIVHVNVVRGTYVIASSYVVADAFYQSHKERKRCVESSMPAERRRIVVSQMAVDSLIWQAFASVIIPGFTINRICKLSAVLLKRYSKLPSNPQKALTTFIGLGAIPVIIHPIDNFVHFLLDNSLRLLWSSN